MTSVNTGRNKIKIRYRIVHSYILATRFSFISHLYLMKIDVFIICRLLKLLFLPNGAYMCPSMLQKLSFQNKCFYFKYLNNITRINCVLPQITAHIVCTKTSKTFLKTGNNTWRDSPRHSRIYDIDK